jgi:hypothetical protein
LTQARVDELLYTNVATVNIPKVGHTREKDWVEWMWGVDAQARTRGNVRFLGRSGMIMSPRVAEEVMGRGESGRMGFAGLAERLEASFGPGSIWRGEGGKPSKSKVCDFGDL